MSYQATRRIENPFQQQLNTPSIDEDDENDEDATHNIKFTIPPSNNEKGKRSLRRKKKIIPRS
jgi:hypothetical protein